MNVSSVAARDAYAVTSSQSAVTSAPAERREKDGDSDDAKKVAASQSAQPETAQPSRNLRGETVGSKINVTA